MSDYLALLDQPQEVRRQVEHRMILDVETRPSRRPWRQRWHLACACGLVVREPLRGPESAHVLYVAHVSLSTGPGICPRCGSGKPSCGQWLKTDRFQLKLPHEVICEVPFADDVCDRCELALELQALTEHAAWISSRMLGAAS